MPPCLPTAICHTLPCGQLKQGQALTLRRKEELSLWTENAHYNDNCIPRHRQQGGNSGPGWREVVQNDLQAERPLWALSCYASERESQNDLLGDISPEEVSEVHETALAAPLRQLLCWAGPGTCPVQRSCLWVGVLLPRQQHGPIHSCCACRGRTWRLGCRASRLLPL